MAIEVANRATERKVALRIAQGESRAAIRAELIASGCSYTLADRYIGRATAKPLTERAGKAIELTETSNRLFTYQQSVAVESAWKGIGADIMAMGEKLLKFLGRKV